MLLCARAFNFFVLGVPREGGGTAAVRRSRGGDSDIEGRLPQPHGKDGLRQEVRSIPPLGFFVQELKNYPFAALKS